MQLDEDLLALRKIWYKKLKDDGFEDIENTDLPEPDLKAYHAPYFQYFYDPFVFQMQQEYYRRAGLFLNQFKFKNKTEREIWRLHSEGISLRKISNSLKTDGVSMNKDYINKVVTQLASSMKACDLECDD